MTQVQRQNYLPNSLRKNRVQAFEQDIQRIYIKYLQSIKSIMVEQLTIALFSNIWEQYNMQYIFHCLCEDESEEEFAYVMYEVVLKKYFIYKHKHAKVFAIFSLYFLHYSCQNRKKINLCPTYLNELKTFLNENKNDKNCHYMKIAYQLHQKCIVVCTKIGLRNPIIRSNIQASRKPVIVGVQPLQHIGMIEQQFREWNNPEKQSPSLKQCLTNYDKLKKQLFRENIGSRDSNAVTNGNTVNNSIYTNTRDKFPLDVHFGNRVDRIIRNYKEYVCNNINNKKKQEDQ